MRKFLFILGSTILLLSSSCGTAKKAQKIQTQLTQRDSSEVIIVTPGMQSPELDSLQKVLTALDSQKISDYKTFTAKVKLDYASQGNSANATANIHLLKDSVIWVSLTGPFAIEGYRIMIRPDSIVLMDKLKHVVTRRSIDYLEKIAQLPISFEDLQNIIIGNPLFTKGKIASYSHIRNKWYVSLQGDVFKNFMAVVNNNRKLILKNSRLENSTRGKKRTCNIEYSSYSPLGESRFSSVRKISLKDKTQMEVKLQFKEFNFNQPVTFPFSIPKSYTEN